MEKIFSDLGFPLDETKTNRFWKYYKLLNTYSDELDLTRLKRFDDIIIKHFIDSIIITRYHEIPSPLLDIGTGAGFPGIPLKIFNPETRLILAEPRRRRVDFLKRTIDELELADIEIYPHLVGDHSFFETAGVITRAVESMDDTLSRVLHFLPQGGTVLFMKGPAAGKDMGGLSPANLKNYSLIIDKGYILPGTGHKRRLVVFKKQTVHKRVTYRIMTRAGETPGKPIASSENKTFKNLKKSVSPDGTKKTGMTLVAGKKEVLDLLREEKLRESSLVIFDGYNESDEEMISHIEHHETSGRLFILKKSLFNELDIFNTSAPLLFTPVPQIPEWKAASEAGCTLLVPFQDPVNVGALIRSAVGFSATRIVLLKEAANPFHPRAVRSSGGAVFSAKICRGPSLFEIESLCRDRSLSLVTLDASGTPLRQFFFPDSFLLLPGIEGPGLPEQLKKHAVSIPIALEIESLNAATAAAIALYEWKTRAAGTSEGH